MVGFVAAFSLLLRHWSAIEKYHQLEPTEDITTPLLQVLPLLPFSNSLWCLPLHPISLHHRAVTLAQLLHMLQAGAALAAN